MGHTSHDLSAPAPCDGIMLPSIVTSNGTRRLLLRLGSQASTISGAEHLAERRCHCLRVHRSCRDRLEAHNSRQREKWTVGGRRRSGEIHPDVRPSVQRLSMPAALPRHDEQSQLPGSYLDAGGHSIFMDPPFLHATPLAGQVITRSCMPFPQ